MIDISHGSFDDHRPTISVAALNLIGRVGIRAVIRTQVNAIRDFLRELCGTIYLLEGMQLQWLFDLTGPSSQRSWSATLSILLALPAIRAIKWLFSGSSSCG